MTVQHPAAKMLVDLSKSQVQSLPSTLSDPCFSHSTCVQCNSTSHGLVDMYLVALASCSICVSHLCKDCCASSPGMQDVVAGDGTTTVTVLCGALLSRCLGLLDKNVHPTLISEAFQLACNKAVEVVKDIAQPVDLKDKDALIDAAMTYVHTASVLLPHVVAHLAHWHCTTSKEQAQG